MSPSWCNNCGHRQDTDHLGDQPCDRCGSKDWTDIYSFEICNTKTQDGSVAK